MRSSKKVVGAPKQEVVSIFLKKKQSMIGFTVHNGVQRYCNHAFTLTTPHTHTRTQRICRTAFISEMSCASVGLVINFHGPCSARCVYWMHVCM